MKRERISFCCCACVVVNEKISVPTQNRLFMLLLQTATPEKDSDVIAGCKTVCLRFFASRESIVDIGRFMILVMDFKWPLMAEI